MPNVTNLVKTIQDTMRKHASNSMTTIGFHPDFGKADRLTTLVDALKTQLAASRPPPRTALPPWLRNCPISIPNSPHMFRVVVAQQFIRRMSTGKTKPCLIGCVTLATNAQDEEDEAAASSEVELVVKFSDGCEAKKKGLVAEVLAAALAADLDLPVPQPFLVQVEADFVASIPDVEIRGLAERSGGWAFGSEKLPPQYSTIMAGIPLPIALVPMAAEIMTFDAMIANPDRRVKNPNCLSNSRTLAIFDHELAFQTEGILFWKPPWQEVRLPLAINGMYSTTR